MCRAAGNCIMLANPRRQFPVARPSSICTLVHLFLNISRSLSVVDVLNI